MPFDDYPEKPVKNSTLIIFWHCRFVNPNVAPMSQKNSYTRYLLIRESLPVTLLRKETLAQVFSCKFSEISKKTFFTEHFQWLLLIKNLAVTI